MKNLVNKQMKVLGILTQQKHLCGFTWEIHNVVWGDESDPLNELQMYD